MRNRNGTGKGLDMKIRVSLVLVLGVALLAWAGPAAAGHKTDPHSKNLHPMGHTGDNRPVVTFGEAFFTDLAFKGKIAYQGTWIGGFRTVNIAAPGKPKVLAEVDCGSEQGDVGVYRNLVFRSIDVPVEATTPEETCTGDIAGTGFEGIQIFQVDDPKTASADDLVTAVATDCGSHTHTVVPDPENGRVLLYNSISAVGPTYPVNPIWGQDCSEPFDKFQIVEVPLDAPEDAAVIADVPLGLATEGHHAACHDIGALLNGDTQLAVCAAGQAVLFDISDPAHPVRLRDFGTPGVPFWHSAALSWDGSVAVMGWEPGGGIFPRCLATGSPLAPFDEPGVQTDDMKSIFFFSTETGDLLGKWTLPRAQTTLENCTIHNYSIVPTGKRDVLTTGAYQAGTWVVDFTNPMQPKTVAWSDPPPIPCCTSPFLPLSLGGAWGSYWYNNFIYESNITEGLNIFRLSSSVTAGARKRPFLNPQTQIGPIG
jgi:hypothetical protein